jgi:TolB-like protein
VLAALFSAATLLTAAPAAPRTKVAVIAFKGATVADAKTADLLTDTFVATLQHLRGFEVLSSKDIEMALGFERQRQLLGCTETHCLAELGGSLGADYLVSGSLGRLGSSVVLNVESLNMRTNVVDQRFSRRFKAGEEEGLLDALGPAAEALFPAADAGPGPPATSADTATPVLKPARLKPELEGQHPRLLCRASDLAQIRARITAPELKDEWAALLGFAKERIAQPTDFAQPPQLTRAVESLGPVSFVGWVAPDQAAQTTALNWMKSASAVMSWPGEGELESAQETHALAVGYDLLYGAAPPQVRAAALAALKRHAGALYEKARKPTSWAAAWESFRGVEGYSALGVAALAVLDDAPEAQAWLDLARERLQAVAGHLSPDGAAHEGPNANTRTLWWMVHFADALERVTGSDEVFKNPWLRAQLKYRAYTLMPDGRTLVPFGDSGSLEQELVSDVLSRLSIEYRDGLSSWLAAEDRQAWPKWFRIGDFAWGTGAAPVGPEKLPPSAVFTDLGVAALRTGWDANAAVLVMKCGPPGGARAMREAVGLKDYTPDFGRSHPDASTFVFWQDRRWQLTLPGGDTRDKHTRFENVWLASGRGQRGEGAFLNLSSYLGAANQARLLHAGASDRADFAVCESAPAYEEAAALKSARRTVVLVRGEHPYALVLDRLTASAPRDFSLVLHHQNEFEVKPNEQRFHIKVKNGVTGSFLAPAPLHVEVKPLKVIDNRLNEVNRGFELEAQVPQAARATWLVTVLDPRATVPQLVAGEPAPVFTVGPDTWSWDEQGIPSLNGQPLPATLIR